MALGWSATCCGQAESTTAEAEAARAQFEQKNDAVKEAFRQIEALRTEFQSADTGRRMTINEELAKRIAETQPLIDEMVVAAAEVYRTEPQADLEIEKLLVAVARHHTIGRQDGGRTSGGDQYEKALPIINALIDGKAQNNQLPVWGFVCAFVANDYDLADRYWLMAQEAGSFNTPSELSESEQQIQGYAKHYHELLGEYRPIWAQEKALREQEAAADDLPRIKLTTTKGDIVIELFENEAPQAVANFITLTKDGFYDGLTFHRVIPGFMAQGGDPSGDGTGGPGYHIRCECTQPNHRKHFRGSLSMAHAGRNTGGSQFFLTFVPTSHLNGQHTAFGRVIEGMEVLGDLEKVVVSDESARFAQPPDRIIKAEVLRDRGHAYEFEKLPE
jgi:cyclophilin family peptidyl-prolyl cis-trans isomerase